MGLARLTLAAQVAAPARHCAFQFERLAQVSWAMARALARYFLHCHGNNWHVGSGRWLVCCSGVVRSCTDATAAAPPGTGSVRPRPEIYRRAPANRPRARGQARLDRRGAACRPVGAWCPCKWRCAASQWVPQCPHRLGAVRWVGASFHEPRWEWVPPPCPTQAQARGPPCPHL